MNKPWLGYVSSALFLLAGILMIAGNKTITGVLFIILSIASVILNVMMNKKRK
ncbi:MAG: hypothetical protein H0W61_16860 [Bacteroidetes bacterium]|nr:hypothetical protein [Bacteroidota bacterium]